MADFDFSKGVARYSAAMTTGSDEVPFIAQMHEFAMVESGIPGDEFYTDAKKFARVITLPARSRDDEKARAATGGLSRRQIRKLRLAEKQID